MSYQIYYERAFIKVNDKFIPLVNSGSNNCWDISIFSNRDVPEKYWSVLNYQCSSKLLFTKNEIYEQAEKYEEISINSGTCFKSRNKPFETGEFEQWIANGMKNAYTIEEYIECGNKMYIHDRSEPDANKRLHPFSSTEEFLSLLEMLGNSESLDIEFADNRRVYRPIIPSKAFELKQNGKFYVLKSLIHRELYFCSVRKRTVKYTDNPYNYAVRAFATQDEAEKYLEKYKDRLSRFQFFVKQIGDNAFDCIVN